MRTILPGKLCEKHIDVEVLDAVSPVDSVQGGSLTECGREQPVSKWRLLLRAE
jgi:hypothetical protein